MEFRYEGNSKKGGIYKIINIQNGRFYIGSAKEFKNRWSNHYSSLRRNRHHNKFLQNDFNKYGEKTFLFEIVEVMLNHTTEERRLREQAYIDQSLNDLEKKDLCFNLAKNTVLKEGPWSSDPEATRIKMSEASKKRWNKPRYRDEISEKMKKGWTQEAREEASKRFSGEANHMYGKVISDETKKLLSDASKKMWKNEEIKQSILNGLSDRTKKQWEDEEVKEKMRTAIKNSKNTEAAREQQKNKATKQWEDEEIRTRMVQALNSNEVKEKQSVASKKLWQSEQHRKKMSDVFARIKRRVKTYILLSPENIETTIVNLKRFCEENNLSYNAMNSLANGRIKIYKGWKKV